MTQEKLQYIQMIKGAAEQIEQALLEVMLPDELPQLNRYGANRVSKRRKATDMLHSVAPRP
jgi:hypothetical protein